MIALSSLETSINTLFSGVVAGPQAALLTIFQAAFVAGLGIWIILVGYSVAMGKSEDGVVYAFTKLGRIFLVGTLALHGWPMIQELMSAIRDGMVAAMGGGSPTIAGVIETQIFSPMDDLRTAIDLAYKNALSALGYFSLDDKAELMLRWVALVATFYLLWLPTAIFVMIIFGIFMLSTATFYVLLALGPFFLMTLAFPFTQRFFELWVGSVITTSLAGALAGFLATTFTTLLGFSSLTATPIATQLRTYFETNSNLITGTIADKIMFVLLMGYIAYKVFDIASALGGGLSVGANVLGATRMLVRDALMQQAINNRSRNANSIRQGRTGGGAGGGAGGARGSSTAAAIAANRTLTGMALTAGGRGYAAVSSTLYNARARALESARSVVRR